MFAVRPRRRPTAVIFDMDGLLLDTEPLAARAWGEAAAALDVEFDPALALAMVGRNFADCSAMVRARYGADYPTDALLGRWHATYDGIVEREGLLPKPGVHELLDWLDDREIRARRRDVDAPRAGAREARAARHCSRGSTTWSAATRSPAASPPPTSTPKPRGDWAWTPARASRSRTRNPACARRLRRG